ncbi:hypothetical protein NQ318_019711, partial [Aromia moschata]
EKNAMRSYDQVIAIMVEHAIKKTQWVNIIASVLQVTVEDSATQKNPVFRVCITNLIYILVN